MNEWNVDGRNGDVTETSWYAIGTSPQHFHMWIWAWSMVIKISIVQKVKHFYRIFSFFLFLQLMALLMLTVLGSLCEAGGSHHKHIIIHVPYHVKHHHHTHTIYKVSHYIRWVFLWNISFYSFMRIELPHKLIQFRVLTRKAKIDHFLLAF